MHLRTPPNLHYPITVTTISTRKKDGEIKRGEAIFRYSYETLVPEMDLELGMNVDKPRRLIMDYQSEFDGKFKDWFIEKGQVINRPGTLIAELEEPCAHDMQFAGMCVSCGKDMDEVNYMTTQPQTSRATIELLHGTANFKVSAAEANRSSVAAMQRLLEGKKLSLVVDLDQTVIHAVCDPTVAEWKRDESNPNHEAVKDVQSFELMDEGPNARPCSYYIKPRPGLPEFLEKMSQKYELHIYTMGTRSYAQNVAKIIDPTGKIFSDRILSRDESGSMTVKSLQRLFPVDTKMVVILDDRADVWNWSLNLIRVKAFNFYVGIGDINSSFLPKLENSFAPTPTEDMVVEVKSVEKVENGATTAENTDGSKSIEQSLVQMAGNTDASTVEKQVHEQAEKIAEQVEERPLMKKQQALDKQDEALEKSTQETQPLINNEQAQAEAHANRHALLRNDDDELAYLEKHLDHIHSTFFTKFRKQHDRHPDSVYVNQKSRNGKSKSDDKPQYNLDLVPDVKDLMPRMKLNVLKSVVLCFTGVIPQGIDHQLSDIGIWARTFGARISHDLTKSTTHVIADPSRRTSKVRQAAKHPEILIVDKSWLAECFSAWKRVPEKPYLIEVEQDGRPIDVLPSDVDFIDGTLSEDDSATTNSDSILPDDSDFGDDANEDGEADGVLDDESTPNLDNINWDEIDMEFDEDLGSDFDTDSDEDDVEDEDGNESDASKASKNSKASKTSSRASSRKSGRGTVKRKLSNSSEGGADSALQRRKRRAYERTSSLTKVENAADVEARAQKAALQRQAPIVEEADADVTGAAEEDADDDEDDWNEALEEALNDPDTGVDDDKEEAEGMQAGAMAIDG